MRRYYLLLIAVVVGTSSIATVFVGSSLAVCERAGALGFPNEDFSRNGRQFCFGMTNSDRSVEVLVADLRSGGTSSMAKDVPRCRGGTAHGRACNSDPECPSGSCVAPAVSDCGATAKGKSVFFVFDGNPTGENGDLGDELFSYTLGRRRKPGTLRQVTNQAGWCDDDVSKPCTTAADCEKPNASCSVADMSGLHVAPDGRSVVFVSTGGAGENGGHGSALDALAVGRKGIALKQIGTAGSFCAPNSARRGQPCTKDDDCGAVCGNGLLDPGEQCDGSGCSQGQRCVPGGAANQCTCQPRTCGDGFVDFPGEECETRSDCSEGQTCSAPGPGGCRCVPTTKPTCGNNVKEPGEQCDGTPCPAFRECGAANTPTACECAAVLPTPGSCGNGVLNVAEQCDGLAFPCLPGFVCTDCFCTPDPAARCGNNAIDPGEDCDGTSLGACPPSVMCMEDCECGN